MPKRERVQVKTPDASLEAQVNTALSGPSKPLSAQTRALLEPKFQHNFADVRVYDDAPDTLNARAFAVGDDLAFSPGQYAPGTPAGDHLLAHELAHVVQARAAKAQPTRLSEPGEALETEAGQAADAAFSPASNAVSLTSSSAGVVSRSVWDWIPGMGGMSDSEPVVLPQAPSDGVQAGPYMYGGINREEGGINYGYGQGHAQGSSGPVDMFGGQGQASGSYDALKIDGHIGGWSSQRPDGTTEQNIGFQLGGKSPSVSGAASWNAPGVDGKPGPGAYVHGDAAGPAFDVSSYAGPSGFGFGAQASVAGFNVGGGTTGTDVDEYGKFGLSEGVGAAVRGSWGDTDGDGFREYGGGVDVGPVSVDMRTEDPLRAGVRGLGNMLPIPGAGYLAEQFIDPGNFTERTANRVGLTTRNADLGTTWDVAAGAASSAYDTVNEAGSAAYDYAAEGAASAGRGLSNAADSVSEAASSAWNALPDWEW